MQKDDGDTVRGLGFVALYAAYLEEQIDNLLFMLAPVEEFDSKKQRWMISQKIKQAKKLVSLLGKDSFAELLEDLDTCKDLFEDRNEFVHGRIYGCFDRPDTLKSGRFNVPDREINSEELYILANELFGFTGAIYRPMLFQLPRSISEHLSRQGLTNPTS